MPDGRGISVAEGVDCGDGKGERVGVRRGGGDGRQEERRTIVRKVGRTRYCPLLYQYLATCNVIFMSKPPLLAMFVMPFCGDQDGGQSPSSLISA